MKFNSSEWLKKSQELTDVKGVALAVALGLDDKSKITKIRNGERALKFEEVVLAAIHMGVPIPINEVVPDYKLDVGSIKVYRDILVETLEKCARNHQYIPPDIIIKIVDKTYDRFKENPESKKINEYVDILLSYEEPATISETHN